ncbi:MAG TPA: tetratricopeptide repeat protein [Paludibacteraceae bacterium]|nr:tetratricopeptide repeat protein [Paludibacteraceae bacterium]HQF49377.1 tetratricopeptide repeat protein [Paludibacteraceae bacterium]HQJ88989.1 tetratricopeptide repeat protein [Paludibacteraceae bacterium]
MKILKSILLVTLLLQPLSLCLYATNTSKVGSEATICAYNDSVNERKFQYYYLEALRQKMQGKYSEAADNLLRCLCLNPKKASVYSELANLNISANKSAVAKNFMKKAVELEPSNTWFKQVLAQLYIQNQEFDKAAATYEDIALQHPANVEYFYYVLAQLYTQMNMNDKALNAYNMMEKTYGVNDRITLEKFKIYAANNEEKKAFKEIDYLIKAYPKETKYQVLKGDLYLAVDKKSKAEKTYKSVLSKHPDDATANTQLAMLYFSDKREDEGLQLVRKVLLDTLADLDIKKNVLAYIAQDSLAMTKAGDAIFTDMIKMYPDEEFTYLSYSSYLLDKKDMKGFEYLKKALEINPKYEESWNLMINYYSLQHDTAKVISSCIDALEQFPENPDFHYMLGSTYQMQGKLDSAINQWEKAVELVKDKNLNLASAIQGSIGDVLSSMGKKDEAYTAYDTALVYNKDNILVLNNYAYALSVEGKELQKAERMSGIAVQSNPTSAVFLDTYAWVYFKQGNYLLAMIYIEQAYNNGGSMDPDVMEHYGDILFKNGDSKKAADAWMKALQIRKENNKLEGFDGLEKLKQKAETGNYVE